LRVGLGIPGRPKSAQPGLAPGWLADVLSLGPPGGGGAGNFTTGINFVPVGPRVCTGVRACWGSINVGTIPVELSLWNVNTGALIATETVNVVSGIVQTTAAFGSHTIVPTDNYAVSTRNPSLYNGYVANGYFMPRSYPKYTVGSSYAFTPGFNYPIIANNSVCAFVEPIL
jgi:hypothetical protein